jgi:hypothetical protein
LTSGDHLGIDRDDWCDASNVGNAGHRRRVIFSQGLSLGSVLFVIYTKKELYA